MKRILWCLPCFGVLLFACFGTRPQVPPSPPSDGTVTTRLQAPAVQRTIHLQAWQWNERLFPTDSASAYTVIVTAPEFPGKFIGYGFDVKRGAAPFAVVGSLAYRERFMEKARQEMTTLPGGLTGLILLDLTQRAIIRKDCGDAGISWEGPPIGEDPGSGDPPVDQPYIERYAFSLALGRNEALMEGYAAPTDVIMKLETPTTRP